MPTTRPRAPAPEPRRGDALLDRLLQPNAKRTPSDTRRTGGAASPAGLGSFWALAHKTAPKK